MVEELKDSIHRIRIDLEALKANSPSSRDYDRLESQISLLKECMNTLLVKLDSKQEVDLGPALSSLQKVETKAEAIFNKIPPMPSLIAAALIVIGVLGLSYKDLQSFSKPVTEASQEVTRTTGELRKAITAVQKDFNEINDMTSDLENSLKKISNIDRALAKMLAEVQRISTSARLISNNNIENRAPNGESSLATLFNAIGNEMPPEMNLLMQANNAIDNYEYAKARELASKAKIIDSDKSQSIYDSIIAKSFTEEGKYREAIGAYMIAIELEPDEPTFHNNLGSAYFALSQEAEDPTERSSLLEKSISATRESIRLDPGSPEVYANGSIVLVKMNKKNEALNLLNSWDGPVSGDIQYQKAAISALLENIAETISFLSEAISLDAKYALHAAADDDFRGLRKNEGFQTLLEANLGAALYAAVLASWED